MLHIIILYLAAILVTLTASAIYSAAETAMTSISLPKLHKLKIEGHPKAIMVSELREEKEMLLGSLLIASSVLDTVVSAVAISFAIHLGGVSWIPAATAITAILIVAVSDILPKTYAFQYPAKTAFAVAPFIKLSVKFLFPFAKLIQFIVSKIFALFKIKPLSQLEMSDGPETLRGAIEMGHSLGFLLKYDKDMLDSILSLADYTLEDVMTHRKHVISFDINTEPTTLLKKMLNSGHSRFPIWEEKPDNIIGVIHIKNMLNLLDFENGVTLKKQDLLKIMSTPWFVPTVTMLSDQLRAFRNRKNHFAIVVDEYGDMQGVVSLEDILEEIVGNIYDEHDTAEKEIKKLSEGWYSVKGTVTIRDINRHLGWHLPDEEASTIAGLVIHESEKIPEIGENFTFHKVKFEITGKDRNQITHLKIKKVRGSAKTSTPL